MAFFKGKAVERGFFARKGGGKRLRARRGSWLRGTAAGGKGGFSCFLAKTRYDEGKKRRAAI
jgi:hypothetical protein